MTFVYDWGEAFWDLLVEMAPWLLLGFAMAGLLTVIMKPKTIARLLGGQGLWTAAKATLLGVPMPLCSCGVIPVATALSEQGASRSATTSFLTSTPQTGVDSIVPTWVILGPVITIVKVVAAVISGLVSGLLAGFLGGNDSEPEAKKDSSCCHEFESKSDQPDRRNLLVRIKDGLQYGLFGLPGELAISLVIGLALGGLITVLFPASSLADAGLTSGFSAYLMVTLLSVPLYVCATGSIPLAASLLGAGLSPGAALVLLIAGPATNITTITVMLRVLKWQGLTAYLVTIIGFAWIFAFILDFAVAPVIPLSPLQHGHVEQTGSLLAHGAAIFLGCIVLYSLCRRLYRLITRPKNTPGSHHRQAATLGSDNAPETAGDHGASITG